MWNRLVADANRLYVEDGGRDLPAGTHPRTNDQRLFDAAAASLSGTSNGAAEGGSARPVIAVTAQALAGTADIPAELIGTGPIPRSLLEAMACRSDFVGLVFGQRGQVLWQGRRLRFPNAAQKLALQARDKGCVLCGAAVAQCEAHHIIPFNAPAQGATDIDNLVLVCRSCHRSIHEEHQTIERSTNGWSTRPATESEIALTKPTAKQSRAGPRHGPTRRRPARGDDTAHHHPTVQARPSEPRQQPSLL